MSSTGPFKLHLPMLPCDASSKTRLQRLPSNTYQLTFFENPDRVSIVVDLHSKHAPMSQVFEMIVADMKRAFCDVARPPVDSGPTNIGKSTFWHKMLTRWSPTIFTSLWARHPLAEVAWYRELRNAVYYEVFNCYRKSKFTGIVLFFVTPRVRNHYTNLELPGLSLDLYNAYQDGCTPFYEDGKEVIPYTYVGFKRCGVDELSNYLQQEISMAGKAGTIVSCSEEDWVKAQNISEKWEVGWLAKRKTDQR